MLERFFVAVALAAAILGLSVSTASATLSAPVTTATDVEPGVIDLGDLNGDGYKDIVANNTYTGSVSVLLNNRNRTFAAATNYFAPGSFATKLGHFNDDAHLDMATTMGAGRTVQIRLGNGDGTFGNATTVGTGIPSGGNFALGISVGRFNADSTDDLAVTAFGSNQVMILLGNGDGTFAAGVGYATGGGSRSVSIGDLNGDDHQDLVVTNSNAGNLSVLLGTGTGTFTAGTTVGTGFSPYFSTLADLDGDGKLDLAQTNRDQRTVAVRIGNGDGTFQANTDYTTGQYPAGIAHSDLDGDGDIDLAAANNNASGGMSLFLNNGDGTFATAVPYAVGSGSFGIAIGDLDNSPGPDIAVSNQQSHNVSALFNQAPFAQAAPLNPDFGSGDLHLPGETLTVTVTNASGGDPLEVTDIDVVGTNAGDFEVTDEDCTNGTVALSGTCEISLLFTPSAAGNRSAQLEVDYAGGFEAPLTTNLQGTGIEPTAPDTAIDTSFFGPDWAEFGFSGTPGTFEISKYQCRIDAGAYFDCSSPHRFENLAMGDHTAYFRAEDTFGLPDPTPVVREFTIVPDVDTVIDSGPDGTIRTDSATFAFHGEPAAATGKVMCRLDDGAYFDCASPHTFEGLGLGEHTVQFRAENTLGTWDATPASREFSVAEPIVEPEAPARIGMVVVKGPAKVKRGKKTTYRIRITNTGGMSALGVKVVVKGKGIKKLTRKAGTIEAGKTRVVKVKLKPRKPGKIKATFRVTSSNAGAKAAKKTIRVRR